MVNNNKKNVVVGTKIAFSSGIKIVAVGIITENADSMDNFDIDFLEEDIELFDAKD